MRVHSLVVCLFVVASAGLLYGQGPTDDSGNRHR